MKPVDFFSNKEKEIIGKAIKEAELNTSGEIRLHIESQCKEDVLDRAAYLFKKLKMHNTKLRNGVLFYLAFKDKKFAILGDAGINKVCPDNFWDDIKEMMKEEFKNDNIAEGLAKGIKKAGEQLKASFPYQTDDVNELANDISFGKE
jgi:uncharacterized membrane protein